MSEPGPLPVRAILRRAPSPPARPRWLVAALIAVLACVALPSRLAAGEANAEESEASPFVVTPTFTETNGGKVLTVAFRIPSQHHLYADELSFELNGQPARFALPAPFNLADKHSGGTRPAYAGNFVASQPVPDTATPTRLVVHLRGCNDSECFFPESRQWQIDPVRGTVTAQAADAAADPAAASVASGAAPPAHTISTNGFQVTGRTTGFQAPAAFAGFLKSSTTAGAADAGAAGAFGELGTVAMLGLILLGGLALNLTPCVLPMIPITLAVLGAGSKTGQRGRGFVLGSAYGLGMTLAYGGLGVGVVLTGSRFGALQSSPWFNAGVAAVFVILALAMFDRIPIDLSRFQRAGNPVSGGGAGPLLAAGTMGFVSALLAGACVAPVVISVLLVATTQYQTGHLTGLLLPFVLGLGMAAPWPFAAAGLSFLPKPGAWMTRVKHAFGVIILGFAAWYGWLGWSLAAHVSAQARPQATAAHTQANANTSVDELRRALLQSQESGRPVLVDFWASWCKNCSAMEHTTLQDRDVQAQLSQFIVARVQAERLDDPAVKPTLDQFGVLGLPTFVVLRPDPKPSASAQNAPALP